jgi:hypothetical protein
VSLNLSVVSDEPTTLKTDPAPRFIIA